MSKLFINFSNHPSEKWSDKQFNTALDMVDNGSIIDVPFPNVDPEMTTEDIIALAKDMFYKNIMDVIAECDFPDYIILHVMGEMSFTYNFVNIVKNFKGENIDCVVSTTKRNVVEKDGVKTSVFEFVQFRKY
jgi:hypothetical protein